MTIVFAVVDNAKALSSKTQKQVERLLLACTSSCLDQVSHACTRAHTHVHIHTYSCTNAHSHTLTHTHMHTHACTSPTYKCSCWSKSWRGLLRFGGLRLGLHDSKGSKGCSPAVRRFD